MKEQTNSTEQQCNKQSVTKRFWGGFGKIETEVEWCSTFNPMIMPGCNGLLEFVGLNAHWYEHRVFIGGKPIFRYKSLKRMKIKVTRFLGVCWVNVW
jgi:hypothetical protein